MLVLAAATTALDKLRQIPVEFWLRTAAAIAVVVVVVIALRKLAKVNKAVLFGVVLLGSTLLGFNWIYERNEPSWATPAVGFLAEYLPSKTTYASR